MSLNDFQINLNKQTKFINKKKIIFLVIRKSPGEFDFISYILSIFNKEYNIFTIFNEVESLNNLKKNKLLYNIWKNICFGFTLNTKKRYLGIRLINKIVLNSKLIKNKSFFNEQLIAKYYNFEDLVININNKLNYKKINNQKKSVLFCAFNNKSGWIESFKHRNMNVVLFPDRSGLEYLKEKKIFTVKSNNKVTILFPNKDTHIKYSKKLEFENFIYCSFPKFSNKWIKKLLVKKKKISNQATIFYKTYHKKMFLKNKYFEQLDILIKTLIRKKLKINFNLHPYAKKGFNKYITKYNYKHLKISNKNTYQDIYESEFLINFYGSNLTLDCLAFNKYSIELWSTLNKNFFVKSIYKTKNLSLFCKNKSELIKCIDIIKNNKKIAKIEKAKKKYLFDDNKIMNVINTLRKIIL